jgi:hypothetical protein
MRLYCGVDLHSTNSYLAVLNEQLEAVLDRRVPNRLDAVLGALEPLREQVQGIAVESTFNWYWPWRKAGKMLVWPEGRRSGRDVLSYPTLRLLIRRNPARYRFRPLSRTLPLRAGLAARAGIRFAVAESGSATGYLLDLELTEIPEGLGGKSQLLALLVHGRLLLVPSLRIKRCSALSPFYT